MLHLEEKGNKKVVNLFTATPRSLLNVFRKKQVYI
jgi:hypothetical protein